MFLRFLCFHFSLKKMSEPHQVQMNLIGKYYIRNIFHSDPFIYLPTRFSFKINLLLYVLYKVPIFHLPCVPVGCVLTVRKPCLVRKQPALVFLW